MEELLNKLIEKGWKPFGKTGINEKDGFVYMNGGKCIRLHKGVYAGNMLCGEYNLRELVSMESGLWQFVCEKELVYRIWHDEKTYKKRKNDDGETKFAYSSDYWIIQSSLCEEENIEQFLLNNIKV